MKLNFIKNIYSILGILFIAFVSNSCVREDVTNAKSPVQYTNRDIKSYNDLFQYFWTTMDQRYNYFYEQKRKDGMNWNAVYNEYYPKFLALKTYGKQSEFTAGEIKDRGQKAQEYFKNIVDPIMDRHFATQIYFPSGVHHLLKDTILFHGGMKTPKDPNISIYKFNEKVDYMKKRLADPFIFEGSFKKDIMGALPAPTDTAKTKEKADFIFLGGRLKSNPEIYYLTFNMFSAALGAKVIQFQGNNNYYTRKMNNPFSLTAEDIRNSKEFNAIPNENDKKVTMQFSMAVVNSWNRLFESDEVRVFNEEMRKFSDTEILSDELLAAMKKVKSYPVVQILEDAKLDKIDKIMNSGNKNTSLLKLIEALAPLYSYNFLKSEVANEYLKWYALKLVHHLMSNGWMDFLIDSNILENRAPFYQKFLNPLQKGEFKKIILDLRSNPGGAVIDAQFFTRRFVTKNTTFAYQRTKEGSGKFNYTQWIPLTVAPHRFGMPTDVPIAILTNNRSASMAEISTLMIKSQGKQVFSVGDYSNGATAALTTDPYENNGGLIYNIDNVIRFYMPFMATKDANGDVIEGIGIKPEIYVAPPTVQEVNEMKNSPDTHVDRTLNEAVKALNTK